MTFPQRPDAATPGSTDDEIRAAVRARYAASARACLALADPTVSEGDSGAGGCCAPSCCAPADHADPITRDHYDPDEVPSESALVASLGCGNPTALAQLRPGEDVLDLGSGGGLDVLLSARRVGPAGTAYGLDMTPEMLQLARRNQAEAGVTHARFLLGTIEHVPLPDAAVDVVISNCVVNLSPDKDAVLAEAFRVLRPGGRFAVSDIVLTRPLPEPLVGVVGLWTGCVAGALVVDDYLAKLTAAGFVEPSVQVTRTFDTAELRELAAGLGPEQLPGGMHLEAVVGALDGAFVSAFVRAVVPNGVADGVGS
jgi:ubiquinone/menaquinone biosynthesis C-methylase UbiE